MTWSTTLSATSGAGLPIWVTEAGGARQTTTPRARPDRGRAGRSDQVDDGHERRAWPPTTRSRGCTTTTCARSPTTAVSTCQRDGRVPVGHRPRPRLRRQAAGVVHVVPRRPAERRRLLRRLARRGVVELLRGSTCSGAATATTPRSTAGGGTRRRGRALELARRRHDLDGPAVAAPGVEAPRRVRPRHRQRGLAAPLRRVGVVRLEQRSEREDLREPRRVAAARHLDRRPVRARDRQRHLSPLPQREHLVVGLGLDWRATRRRDLLAGRGLELARPDRRASCAAPTRRSGGRTWTSSWSPWTSVGGVADVRALPSARAARTASTCSSVARTAQVYRTYGTTARAGPTWTARSAGPTISAPGRGRVELESHRPLGARDRTTRSSTSSGTPRAGWSAWSATWFAGPRR